MAENQGGHADSIVGMAIDRVDRLEQAFVHLAKVVELELVDLALDPSLLTPEQLERYGTLGQKLAEISGIAYELVTDISSATGISIITDDNERMSEVNPNESDALSARITPDQHRTTPNVPKKDTPVVEEELGMPAKLFDPKVIPPARPLVGPVTSTIPPARSASSAVTATTEAVSSQQSQAEKQAVMPSDTRNDDEDEIDNELEAIKERHYDDALDRLHAINKHLKDKEAETTAVHITQQATPRATVTAAEVKIYKEGDLYARIINIDRVPEMRPVADGEGIDVKIISANRIEVAGQTIILSKHELFLLNAFLLLRDKPRSGNELRELGFFPDSNNTGTTNTTFSNSMKSLSEKLNQAARKEIIKRLGAARATQYAFNPKVILTEDRTNIDELATWSGADVKKK